MQTDAQGKAKLVLEPGNYTITISHPSYKPVTGTILNLKDGEVRSMFVTLHKKSGTVDVKVQDTQGGPVSSADVNTAGIP